MGVARLARRPNSSASTCLAAAGLDDADAPEPVDETEKVDLADDGGESMPLSLSRFEPPERKKLRPRIDLRPPLPPLSDDDGVEKGSPASGLGDGVVAETSLFEPLREKNGMPDEGVRRGLTTLERDRPGLVVTTAGGGMVAVESSPPWAARSAVRVVLLLLWLEVRCRRKGGTWALPRRLLRPSEPVAEPYDAGGGMLDESDMDERLFVEAARRRGRFDWPNEVVRMRLPAADCRSPNEVDSLTPDDADDIDDDDCCALGLLVALWNALEMLHLRRLDPPDAAVATGSADSPAVLRPLLDVVRVAAIGGACRPCPLCAGASTLGEPGPGCCCCCCAAAALAAGRYVSQSFGSGGTGGISAVRLTDSALALRSSAGRPSPALWIDETSLPALERRYLLAGERVANEVAEVESCEPTAETEVPVAEEDEPRLNGLEDGKGTSTGADWVDDARRFCAANRLVVDMGGMLEVEADSGDLVAACSDGDGSAGCGGTGLAALLAVRELAAELSSPSLGALESPVLVRTRRLAELWLESRLELVDAARSPALRLVLRLRGSDDAAGAGAVVDEMRDMRGELRPSSLASAAAVPSSTAAARSMSTSAPSTSRVWRRIDAATIDGDEWCEWNEWRESRAWSGVRPGVVVLEVGAGGA